MMSRTRVGSSVDSLTYWQLGICASRAISSGCMSTFAVGAHRFGFAARPHYLVGPFGAGADQHRHAAGRLLDHGFGNLPALIGCDAQELAGAAERDQAVDAFLDLEVDQALERRFVDLL